MIDGSTVAGLLSIPNSMISLSPSIPMQPSLHLSHSGSWEAGPEKLILSRQDIVPLAMETACSRAFLSSP